MRRIDGVRVFAEKWRNLRAWGRPQEEVSIEYKERVGGSSGTCWPVRRHIVVRCGNEMPESLKTALHELAHAAGNAEEQAHGPAWRERFARAVEEVTGIAIPGVDTDDYAAVQALALEAMREWWKIKGLDRIWKMAKER